MSGFLSELGRASRARVTAAAAREPLEALRRRAARTPPPPALTPARFGLIAEVKWRSKMNG